MEAPEIKFCKDYTLFVMMNGNRPLNKKKIEKIKADINGGLNLLPYCPVIVFERDNLLHIIDGQHRFTAAKELEKQIYYVVSNELNLFQVATMNSKQDKWTERDFLNCYIELGIEDYIVLKNTASEFKVGLTATAELLMYGNYTKRKEMPIIFREGRFRAEHVEKAKEFLQLHLNLFGRYRFFSDRNLILALQNLQDKGLCDLDFLKEKIQQAPMMMDRQTSPKEYIYNLERVYNHKASTRKIIF